jgi:hypothetical protein
LASRVYIDLVDTDEATAKRLLLAGVDKSGARPTSAPFPGTAAGVKRFPGQGPEISNLPARNRNFSGRADLLERLHTHLQAESAAAVVPTGAVHGLGGVGKTELALEFAHRFASDYDIAWWVPAELPTSATAALAMLAGRLGVEQVADQSEMVAGLFDQVAAAGPVAADLRQCRAARPAGGVAAARRWGPRAGDLPLVGVGPPGHPRCG